MCSGDPCLWFEHIFLAKITRVSIAGVTNVRVVTTGLDWNMDWTGIWTGLEYGLDWNLKLLCGMELKKSFPSYVYLDHVQCFTH